MKGGRASRVVGVQGVKRVYCGWWSRCGKGSGVKVGCTGGGGQG